MSRPELEVADIFRDHGAAWRQANAGHVSLGQMKAMTAIERCRTAALGGHVGRCEKCSHSLIAYNSCRNRHCPKCQGAAAREWLAEREAELLPVPYFHVVYTLPAQIADIAYQNKAVIYDLLFKASAETTLTIAADPKHLGARIGFMSVLHTWGSALTHHPHVHMVAPGGGLSPDGSRWIACRPRYFLTVEVLSALFRRLFSGDAGRSAPRRPPAVFRRSCAARRQGCVQGLSEAVARDRLGGLRQGAVRRAQASVALSVALRRHASCRSRQHPDELVGVTRGYGEAKKPEDFLDSFRAYVRANINTIAALKIVVQRPRDLTRADLRALRMALDQKGYSEANLRRAWIDAKNVDIAASIIGFVRQAALGDPLVPYADRVKAAIQRVLQGRKWTDPQIRWLRRIRYRRLLNSAVLWRRSTACPPSPNAPAINSITFPGWRRNTSRRSWLRQ